MTSLHSLTCSLNFLAQNCIALESGTFKARLLDSLAQISRPFTTPKRNASPDKVNVQFDMLRTLVINHVLRHVNDLYVVAVGNRSFVDVALKFT